MAKYDTEIRLHSDLDNSKLDKGAEHIEKNWMNWRRKPRTPA